MGNSCCEKVNMTTTLRRPNSSAECCASPSLYYSFLDIGALPQPACRRCQFVYLFVCFTHYLHTIIQTYYRSSTNQNALSSHIGQYHAGRTAAYCVEEGFATMYISLLQSFWLQSWNLLSMTVEIYICLPPESIPRYSTLNGRYVPEPRAKINPPTSIIVTI